MTEMDINSDWSESGVSINTAAMRDMLPSISSDVQIVEIEERELDTQSVCQAAEDLLGKVSKDDFAPINVTSSDSIKKNMSASCPPPYPPPLSIPPSSLTLKTEPNVYCPPVLHPNALSPPSKEPTVARSIPPRALRRGPPVEAATPTGLIKETAPLPPRPPDESPLTGDLQSNARLARSDDGSAPPPKTRGRLMYRIRKSFKKMFRRRSPPPTPVEKIYVSKQGTVVNNVSAPLMKGKPAEKPNGSKSAFARIKIFRRPILTYCLLDTGNLSRCLLNEDIWSKLKFPLTQTKQKLRSADGSEMVVLGSIPSFKMYFEGMKTPIEIQDALVVRGLTVPLNFSMAQIEKIKGIIDCSAAPRNVLRIKGEATPLLSLSTPYSKASLDARFDKIINDWKSENAVSAKLQQKSIQVNPSSFKRMSAADPTIPPHLEPMVNPSPGKTMTPKRKVNFPTPSQPTAHMCCGIEEIEENSTSKEKGKERGHTSAIPAKIKEKPSHLKVCDFAPETYPVYLAHSTPLSPNCMTWVLAKVPSLPSKLKAVKFPTLFTGDSNRNFFISHQISPVSGVYSTQLDVKEIRVLVSNRSEYEVLLPCSLKLGSIQRAEKLVEYAPGGDSESLVHQIDHRPEKELSPAEKQERWQFLRENVKLEKSMFNKSQKAKLLQILYDNFDAVSLHSEDFGQSKTEVFELKLAPGTVPHRDKCRPLNPKYLEDLDRQLGEWRAAKIIEPSRSPWAAALVPVRKKNTDTLRWAVDYRKLNEAVVSDSYPLPSIETNLQRLNSSKIFTCLDSAGAFHGIEIAPATRPLTAFISPRGLWQFTRMPFGIKSSPSCYARMVANAMNSLPGDPGEFALAYLDDVLVHSQTPDQHLQHLEEVMRMHRLHGMKVKLSKCSWGHAEADYLGHTVSQQGIKMNESYVKRILDWPLPATVAELRSFLGTTGYYRGFFPHYGILTAEMEGMKSQKGKLVWEPAVIEKFEKLKTLFTQSPVRSYPDFSKDAGMFILETDWSAEARSVVLLQEDKSGGPAKFIGCCAAKNGPAARNYSSNKGELAAVILGLLKYEHLLTWKPFKVITDNSAVSFLRNMKSQRGIYSRWKEILAAFDFSIEHRPGRSNIFADALSRRTDLDDQDDPIDEITEEILDVYNLTVDELLPEESQIEGLANVPLNELQASTAADPTLSKIVHLVKRGTPPTPEERKKMTMEELPYLNRMPTLFVRHQVLMTYAPDNLGAEYVQKICLPEVLWDRIFQATHQGGPAGHHGANRTYDLMKSRVYFPNMKSYVDSKVNSCVPCFEKLKKPPTKKHIQHREHVGRPHSRIYVDLVGPLQKASYKGEEVSYLITILDGFTRFLTAVPIKAITTTAVVDALVERYIYVHGVPETIHTDNGVQFTSQMFQDTMKTFNIRHTTTPAYHPEGNRVERYHRTLMSLLRCEDPLEGTWVDRLAGAVFAMNSAVNRITKMSPFEATFGHPARIPLDAIIPPETNIEGDRHISEYIRDKKVRLRRIYQHMLAHECVAIRRAIAKDMEKSPTLYSVGDRVSLFSPRPAPGVARKLQKHWYGPFRVVKVISPSLLRIRPEGTWSKTRQDIDVTPDRLKKWGYVPTPEQMNTPQPGPNLEEDFSDEIDLVPAQLSELEGLGRDGQPPRPARDIPGPLPPRPDQRYGTETAPSAVPPPSPTKKGDITVKPSTAFPDVTLPRESQGPIPFQPVTDEIVPTTPIRPRSPFLQSTPTENPVSEEDNVTVEPTPPPLPPIPQVLGKPHAPVTVTSHPDWRPPSPVGAHYPTPPPFPLYRMPAPTLSGESPGISTSRHLDFEPGGEENKEVLPPRGNLPPTPLTHPERDELEIEMEALPLPALPAPPTGDTPPPDPPDPPPNTPPCPPPIQPLIDSEKKSVKKKKKLPPILSFSTREKKMLPPLPPRVTRQSSKEMERIKRLSDIPDEEVHIPSPSRKRSQPEEETEPVVLRETRRRIALPAEESPLPATPPRGRRTRSSEPPRSPRSSSRSRTRKSLLS